MRLVLFGDTAFSSLNFRGLSHLSIPLVHGLPPVEAGRIIANGEQECHSQITADSKCMLKARHIYC